MPPVKKPPVKKSLVKKKPKYAYSHQQLLLALDAIKSGETALSVSKRFGVPRSTLIYKATGKSTMNEERRLGPPPRLGTDAEVMLKNWVLAMAKRGFPVSKSNLMTSVQQILRDLKSQDLFPQGRPGPTWLTLFLKRNPEISQRTVEKLSKVRAVVSESTIKEWFLEVITYVNENSLQEVLADPSRIFNMDETAFFLCPKGEKVLGMKGQKNVYEVHSSNEKENLTVLCSISADGKVNPTLVVYPGVRFPSTLKLQFPKDWAMGKTETGWINGQTFYEYFVNYFYKWLVQNKISLPIIVFLDGHKSHLTYHLSKFCSEKNIVLIALPPNCTHVMQPLDVAVFRPVKRGWAEAVHNWRMSHSQGDRLTKFTFAPMLKEVFDKTMKERTIINGFRTCGLFPFDDSAVDYTKVDVFNIESSVAKPRQEPDLTEKTMLIQNRSPENHVEKQCCIQFMESFIPKNLLTEFKETYNKFTPVWNGNESSQDLYVVWKKAMDSITNTPVLSEPAQPAASSHFQEENTPTKISTNRPTEEPSKNTDTPVAKIPSKENLAKVLSPETNGDEVPSPFKNNLLWPGTPEKTKRKTQRRTMKLPAVVSGMEWQYFEDKRRKQKESDEEKKAEKRRIRDEKKKTQDLKKTTKKTKKDSIQDVEEDWFCKVCGGRYSSELILKTGKKWIECDECKSAYHIRCVPKKHLNTYGIEESDEDEEVQFVCHNCISDSDDDPLILSEEEDHD